MNDVTTPSGRIGFDGAARRPAILTRRPLPAALRTAACVAAAVVGTLRAAPLTAQGVGLPLGTPAPSAQVEDLEGNALDLRSLIPEGRPALIEFWASWCENCEALQPQLDRIAAEYADRVTVVAVAVAVSQSVRRVRRHLQEHDPGYPYVWDASGAAVRAYRAPTTSVVVALDAAGRVAYTGSGADQDLLGVVRRLLEDVAG